LAVAATLGPVRPSNGAPVGLWAIRLAWRGPHHTTPCDASAALQLLMAGLLMAGLLMAGLPP